MDRESEFEVDYEIMKALNCLLEMELQDSFGSEHFQRYKEKSKALLSKVLAKLEDNHDYQKYLEQEVKRLEEESESSREEKVSGQTAAEAIIESQSKTICDLKKELEQSRAAYARLEAKRTKEMQTVAVVCQALTDRLRSLNVNFKSDDTSETGSSGAL